MTGFEFKLCGASLIALPSGALWRPERRVLSVSDLHLGKSRRIARREGRLTPPYETIETLARLSDLVAALRPETVVCLGDSFDDDQEAGELAEDAREMIALMQSGRRWIWIAGNHDPAPAELAGAHLAEWSDAGLTYRHIAKASERGEISGHYHPKARLRGRRPCFVVDADRAILPAFGVYTGGLDVTDPIFDSVAQADARVLITGPSVVPAPRAALLQRAS